MKLQEGTSFLQILILKIGCEVIYHNTAIFYQTLSL